MAKPKSVFIESESNEIEVVTEDHLGNSGFEKRMRLLHSQRNMNDVEERQSIQNDRNNSSENDAESDIFPLEHEADTNFSTVILRQFLQRKKKTTQSQKQRPRTLSVDFSTKVKELQGSLTNDQAAKQYSGSSGVN